MNAPIKLLQFSDPHLFAHRDGALRGVCTYDSFAQTIDQAFEQQCGAQAVLLTGDLVNDEPAAYAHVRELLGARGKPVYALPGNHDDPEAMRSALGDAPFQVEGHADLGAWRLVMLDSVEPKQAHGRISAAELARLDDALAMAPERHALVCLHHQPVRMGSRWLDSVGLHNADEFFSVIDRHPQVRAIAFGHVHQSLDARRRGVRMLATPSTCAQFLPMADNFAVDPAPPGYRRLTLKPDGAIDTEVVRLEPPALAMRSAHSAA